MKTSKTYELDTFGSSPACETLAKILNEIALPRAGRLVSRTLQEFDEAAKLGYHANLYTNTPELHTKVRTRIVDILYRHYVDKVKSWDEAIPVKVKTFTLNVLKTKRIVLLERISPNVHK